MPTTVIGNYPLIPRKRTGILSMDLALADKRRGVLGIPLRSQTEIYGPPNVGKSSLGYFLAAGLAQKGQVTICDLENADPEYVQQAFDFVGFNGDVWIIDSTIPKKETIPLTRVDGRKTIKVGAPRYHEEMLMDMIKSARQPEVRAIILDSIGAIQSADEQEGELGEAFWGKRAKLMNQVARALAGVMRNREEPGSAILINHVQTPMGAGKGHTSPGGDGKNFMAGTRIFLLPEARWKLKEDDQDSPVLGFQVMGKVEKLRYGGPGRSFSFYIVPGYGVHKGASALFDCIKYGLVENGTTIKIDGKSAGYIRKDFLTYAATGKMRKFDPFFELLDKYEETIGKELNDNADKEDGEPDGSDVHDKVADVGRSAKSGERTTKKRGRTRKS